MKLSRRLKKKKNKSGSTAAVAIVQKKGEDRYLYVANCGDARIVLVRKMEGIRLTIDDKADGSNKEEVERLESMKGLIMQGKVGGALGVTRSFGDLEFKRWIIPTPHVKTVKLEPGDTHLVVACDGLWDVATDQQVADIVTRFDLNSAQLISDRLLDHALKNGTKDNVSIIVVAL